jgi:recyclin-1
LLLLAHLPIPDVPAYARTCHTTVSLVHDDSLWEKQWRALGIDQYALQDVLNMLEARSKASTAESDRDIADEEFGDFMSVSGPPSQMGNFVGGGGAALSSLFMLALSLSLPHPSTTNATFKSKYIHAHSLLKGLLPILAT